MNCVIAEKKIRPRSRIYLILRCRVFAFMSHVRADIGIFLFFKLFINVLSYKNIMRLLAKYRLTIVLTTRVSPL